MGAKAQIQKLVAELAEGGMGMVFISAELDEVVRISDRIAVLRDGHCVAQVGSDCGVKELTALIAGECDMMRKLTASPLLWPVLALAALLVVNVILTPSFLSIGSRTGTCSAV